MLVNARYGRKLCRGGALSGLRSLSADRSSEDIIQSCKDYTMWSWSAQKTVSPIHLARAQGSCFWDGDGKRYIDMNSQLMCSNIGHQHPRVIQAIKDQADQLCYAGPNMATAVRAEFGPLLAKHTPGDLNKFFFTNGGAEANENALKIARQCTGRHKVITRYRSYHGASHGAIALTGDPRRWPNEPGGLMGGVVRVFDPYKYRSLLYREGMPDQEFSHLMVQQLEETIQYEGPDNIAAMFLETVTGTNGLLPPPEGYLRGVREVLSKYGILMVCDEVMCGLGRTGAWFAVDHWGVVPDIITMAKGVTSAYLPLGVVAMSAQVAAAFDNKAYSGGLTYNGHPMCLAAGVAALRVLEEERLVERAHSMGAIMGEHLENMKHKHVSVGDVRYIGLFGTMELVKNRATKESLAPFNGTHPSIAAMNKLIKDKGLYMFCHWNLLHTTPPLVITKDELDEAFAIIDEALCITDAAYEA